MRKAIAAGIILLSIFAIFAMMISFNDGMEVEEGYWSKIRYTDEVMIGYPDYYQLEIEMSSQGPLPRDLQNVVNYTDTIMIASYSLTFNISGIRDIHRNRSSDEWIGATKPLPLSFPLTEKIVGDATALEVIIEFTPHNFTNILNNDIYIIVIEFAREGDGIDILTAFSITLLPMIVIFVNIKMYHHINSKFIQNITWSRIPKYYLKYFVRYKLTGLVFLSMLVIAVGTPIYLFYF